MSVANFFPFVPDYMSWEDWNGNLIMQYGEEPIPYLDETGWKDVANNLSQLPTFLAYPVPDPDMYEDWQTWAKDFTLIINGPTK